MDNMPRILPPGVAAHFKVQSWTVPPVFRLIEERGKVSRDEMYRVFNMGIGMVLACSADNAAQITQALPEAGVIGEVVAAVEGAARVVID